jgi:hypothetical protein
MGSAAVACVAVFLVAVSLAAGFFAGILLAVV